MKNQKYGTALKSFKWSVVASGLIFFIFGFFDLPAFADEKKETCFGFVWCHVQEGDRSSTDAFFYLYSAEERMGYSRFALRPFYSEEYDLNKNYHRKSVFWPFGNSQNENDDFYNWIIPFYYNHENNKTGYSYRFVPSIYGYYSNPEKSITRLSLIGFPPLSEIDSFPTLSLYEHATEKEGSSDRLFPLYRYKRWDQDTKSDLNIILLFNRKKTPEEESEIFIPFFSYNTKHADKSANLSLLGYQRFSLFWYNRSSESIETHFVPFYGYRNQGETSEVTVLGLPPMGSLALSLFDYRKSPDQMTSRFFPVYGYHHDLRSGNHDLTTLLLYRHEKSDDELKDAFLPVYNYERNETFHQGHFGAIGIESASLYFHQWDAQGKRDWLVPFYGYRNEGETSEVTALGLPPTGSLALSFFVYRKSPNQTTSRFFPIYGYDHDLKTNRYDLNALLIYRHQESSEMIKGALLPIYHYERNETLHQGHFGAIGIETVSLYLHEWDTKGTSDWLVPLYGYRHEGETSEVTALGLPPVGSLALSFFDYRKSPDQMTSRFFPVYGYDHDLKTNRYDLNALLLYRHQEHDKELKDAFLPLYNFERNDQKNVTRFGLLGFSKYSLYYHLNSPDMTKDRFFPMYGYHHDLRSGNYDLTAFLLYRHEQSEVELKDALFPVYNYERNSKLNQGHFGAIGIETVSLYLHEWDTKGTSDWLVPFYGYRNEGETSEVTALGLPPTGSLALSLFDYRKSPDQMTSRIFPVYGYDHDLKTDHFDLNVLLIYRHEESKGELKDAFFPLYSFARNDQKNETGFGLLGISKYSLYYHLNSAQTTKDRFFPIYTFNSDRSLNQSELDVLWPLADYKTEGEDKSEFNLLWWLVNFQKTRTNSSFRFLGGSTVAFLIRERSENYYRFELNPILPLYSMEEDNEKGSEWNLFGGLVGYKKDTSGKGRMRFFWII